MKPLGKAMKIAFKKGADRSQALRQLLKAYRATPHSATGVPPGSFLLRGGYRADLPNANPINEEAAHIAREKDKTSKAAREQAVNAGKKKRQDGHGLIQGDQVLARNFKRKSKMDPIFESEPYILVDVGRTKCHLLRLRDRKEIIRHSNDVKKYKENTRLHHPTQIKRPSRSANIWSRLPDEREAAKENKETAGVLHSGHEGTHMSSDQEEAQMQPRRSQRVRRSTCRFPN